MTSNREVKSLTRKWYYNLWESKSPPFLNPHHVFDRDFFVCVNFYKKFNKKDLEQRSEVIETFINFNFCY